MDSRAQLIQPSSSESKESADGDAHDLDVEYLRWKIMAAREDFQLTKDLNMSAHENTRQVIIVLFVLTVLSCMFLAYFFIWRGIRDDYGSDLSEFQASRHLVRTTSRNVLRLKQRVPVRCQKPAVICDPMPVLCTLGADGLSNWIVLPPIGYCSIIFFEALGYRERDLLGAAPSERLSNFMRRASERAGSEFGVAFESGYAKVALGVLEGPNGTEALVPFQQHGIFHFGVLDPSTSQSPAEVNIRATLDLFKLLRQFQRTRDADTPYLLGGIVFGVRMTPRQAKAEIDLINDVVIGFKVDMLVAKTHMRETHGLDIPCRITAPTTWDHKYVHYELPMRAVVELLSERGYFNLDIPVSVSFSLKGFWYAPMHTERDRDFAPGSPCAVNIGSELASYTEVCDNPDYRGNLTAVDEGHFFNYTFNKEKRLTFTFDSLQTITKKAVLAHSMAHRVSFAVFDVDYEDVYDECPNNVYGAFDRVAGVRWLTDRFKALLTADAGTSKRPA